MKINAIYVKQMMKMLYIIICCPFMSTRYTHLPITHDIVAKTLYKEIIKKTHPEIEVPKEINRQEYMQKVGDNEYWWYLFINTAQKFPHNKPNVFI